MWITVNITSVHDLTKLHNILGEKQTCRAMFNVTNQQPPALFVWLCKFTHKQSVSAKMWYYRHLNIIINTISIIINNIYENWIKKYIGNNSYLLSVHETLEIQTSLTGYSGYHVSWSVGASGKVLTQVFVVHFSFTKQNEINNGVRNVAYISKNSVLQGYSLIFFCTIFGTW